MNIVFITLLSSLFLFSVSQAEHKMRYYELYQEFQGLFEEQLEKFQRSLNLSPSQFFARCKEASAEDEKCRRYIDILLSSAEYETFVKLMKIMRPIAEARMTQARSADSKFEEDFDENEGSSAKAPSKGGDDGDMGSDSKYVEMDDLSDAKGGAKDYDSSK